jgi:hypothetical protein
MDPSEAKALANIEKYGCHVLHIMEEDDLPEFTYSVGIERASAAPEAVVVGLRRELSHSMINEYNRRIREGEAIRPGQLYEGFLEDFSVTFKPVEKSHYEEYFGWNRWLYSGNDFRVLQLVWPSTSGIWPWEEKASDDLRKIQPLLFAT